MCVSTEPLLRVGLCVRLGVRGGRLVVKVVVTAVLWLFGMPVIPLGTDFPL